MCNIPLISGYLKSGKNPLDICLSDRCFAAKEKSLTFLQAKRTRVEANQIQETLSSHKLLLQVSACEVGLS